MGLSVANAEVLRDVRAGVLSRGALLQLPIEELREAHHAEEQLDARGYAAWAGRRMVRSMNASQEDLTAARMWYEQKLQRGYLVQKEFVSYAFRVAVRFAGRKYNGEED